MYYELCVSLPLALFGKLISVFADTLYLGHSTVGCDWFTTCDCLHFVFILWCFFVFLCSWVCSDARRINIFKYLSLKSPEVLLILYLKLSSSRYTCLSCREMCWLKKVVEYYGDFQSWLWISLWLDILKKDKQLLSHPVEVWVFLSCNNWNNCKSC